MNVSRSLILLFVPSIQCVAFVNVISFTGFNVYLSQSDVHSSMIRTNPGTQQHQCTHIYFGRRKS